MTSSTASRALGAALALLLLTSCDPDAPSDPRGSPRPEEAVAGGKITLGVFGEPPTLDPYAALSSDLTYALARPVYRSLFRIEPDGTVSSDLVDLHDAGSLVSVRNGAVVRLERARWSDGTPITARDVVRSVRQARRPSGFAGLEARALSARRVRFTGNVFGDWARRLALGTFVVPRRGNLRVGSGPFVAVRHVPGLELVYEPNPEWSGDPPLLDRLTVRFLSSTQIALELLERGRLDAAAVPSAINLGDRLDEIGVAYEETRGWETIALDLRNVTDRETRSAIVGAIDRDHIAQGLIRADGGVTVRRELPQPEASPRAEIRLGTASGDELLQLMQRVMQKDLATSSVKAELVQIDPATLYGEWTSDAPIHVALRREIVGGFNGAPVPGDLSSFPLFSVHTFVAFDETVRGIEANGTLDGPLWNAQEWWLD